MSYFGDFFVFCFFFFWYNALVGMDVFWSVLPDHIMGRHHTLLMTGCPDLITSVMGSAVWGCEFQNWETHPKGITSWISTITYSLETANWYSCILPFFFLFLRWVPQSFKKAEGIKCSPNVQSGQCCIGSLQILCPVVFMKVVYWFLSVQPNIKILYKL